MKPRRFLDAASELLHQTSSPHQMALGFTLGLALSFIPVPLVGMLGSLALASWWRANLLSTYLGTALLNPVTGPFFFFAELWVGVQLVGGEMPSWASLAAYGAWEWWALVQEMIAPFLVGAASFVVGGAVLGYPLSFAVARRLRASLDRRAAERALSSPPGSSPEQPAESTSPASSAAQR